MSYRPNQSQQLSIFDRSLRLTERERKCLEKSWAKVFSDEIFPAIDEERFRVLYSENASRPNTPVNIIVGALIIKELFDLSDDEMVENLMLDIHYQYALRTTSFEEQPLSDKTLSRFRRRCYEYECAHGVDLFYDCVKDLSEKIAKMMGINSRIKRMDSLMIEANIRNLSRIELLYSCVARAVKYHHKNHTGMDLSGLEHYTDPDDRNLVIYHSRNIDIDTRTAAIIKDADILLERCQDKYSHVKEHQLLLRCLDEQTAIDNGGRRLRIKGEESPKPTSLQNPTDPEATFSAKAGKKHIGYVANIVETVSNGGSVIVDYGLKAGAVATSISHDSHNIIVVGTNEDDMAFAANQIVQQHGGIVVVENGEIRGNVVLEIAGIMSDCPLTEMNEKLEGAKAAAFKLGVKEGIDPFMTLSFMALPVIPTLRITTRGIIDVVTQQYT